MRKIRVHVRSYREIFRIHCGKFGWKMSSVNMFNVGERSNDT